MENYCFIQRKRKTEKKEINGTNRGTKLSYLIKR